MRLRIAACRALLGKLLRIQVNTNYPTTGAAYTIPAGNPFTSPNRPEIWAFGLRNPWQCSFDRSNGDIRALMTDIREMTASMRQRVLARS